MSSYGDGIDAIGAGIDFRLLRCLPEKGVSGGEPVDGLCEIPYHEFIADCVARRNIPSTNDPEIGGRATALYQSVLKCAMELRGLPGGVVREPLENLTGPEIDELRAVMERCRWI